MPGRSYNPTASEYGFEGKRKDNEIKGEGNSYDFGARMYDPRLGRMLSRDPLGDLAYPGITPYSGMGDNPISNIDYEGKLIIYFGGFWPAGDSKPQLENVSYWDVQLMSNAASQYKDRNAMFFNGSHVPLSTVFTRSQVGAEAALLYAVDIKKELDRERVLDKNAKITSIAHSMGVAYSQGFLNQLLGVLDKDGHPLFSKEDFGDWNAIGTFQAETIRGPLYTEDDQSKIHQYAGKHDPLPGSQNPLPDVLKQNFYIVDGNHFNADFKDVFNPTVGFNVKR